MSKKKKSKWFRKQEKKERQMFVPFIVIRNIKIPTSIFTEAEVLQYTQNANVHS